MGVNINSTAFSRVDDIISKKQMEYLGKVAGTSVSQASVKSGISLANFELVVQQSLGLGRVVNMTVPLPFYSVLSINSDWSKYANEKGLIRAIKHASVRACYRASRKALQPKCEETLGERIVSEGLSHVFAYEMGHGYNTDHVSLPASQFNRYAADVRRFVRSKADRYTALYMTNVDVGEIHKAKFNVTSPCWAGYNLAIALVSTWLHTNKTTATANLGVDCQDVLDDWIHGKMKPKIPMNGIHRVNGKVNEKKSRQPVSRVLSCPCRDMDDHSSRADVAIRLKQSTRTC